ncbi:hypothetical protein [Kitasatospora sp. NPDC050543]|uniref:hypothetical protein n=1 Tax=Kitasatospora sp. NPDC050543 TaxID=3364054 RepID=UPI0037B64184
MDVMTLLMAEMPEGVSRAEASARLGKLRLDRQPADGDKTAHHVRQALRKLNVRTVSRGSHALAMAADCQVGLERLVGRFTPAQDAQPGKATP